MNELVKQIIEISDWDERENFLTKNKKFFKQEDLLAIIQNLNYYENGNSILIHTCLEQINDIDTLEEFALSGKYGKGALESVLMNKNCTEKIVLSLYNQPSSSKVWAFILKDNKEKYGEDYFESVSEQINELIEDPKLCPAAKGII